MRTFFFSCLTLLVMTFGCSSLQADETTQQADNRKPNIIIIYGDDIGYGDLSCYGATQIQTPNLDRMAADGIRFTDAHATSATCTPSRYSLLVGEYAYRNRRAEILNGDAAMVIRPDQPTLASILKANGYATANIGKWHLGLGDGKLDWNGEIKPGPLEIGFDVNYIIPATNDRVPCVYMSQRRIENLDPTDPITVSFGRRVGDWPTGHTHPQMLRYGADGQHSGTIVNGISRIGYQTGGTSALWVDEEMVDKFTAKCVVFMEDNKDKPFFLFYPLHQNHVPRLPNERFIGKSQCGLRGDAVVEADWSVGQILDTIERLGIADNTIVIFSSDNGPIMNDGYDDGVLRDVNGHDPNGPLRGGKYLPFEGGTRLPLIVHWPGRVKPGVSDALVSQVDLMASLAKLTGAEIPQGAAVDSHDYLATFLGQSNRGRDVIIQKAPSGNFGIRSGQWKYIPAGNRPGWAFGKHSDPRDPTFSEYPPEAMLFNLAEDLGETNNLADQHPGLVKKLDARLKLEIAQPVSPAH